jgi:hypothetical protein
MYERRQTDICFHCVEFCSIVVLLTIWDFLLSCYICTVKFEIVCVSG